MTRRILPILLYHDIVPDAEELRDPYDTHVSTLKAHLAWIAGEGRRGVTLSEGMLWLHGAGDDEERPVAITFDDGWRSTLSLALAALRSHGFAATVFIATDLIGADRMLGRGDLRALREAGIEIGSHGRTHRYLSELQPEEVLEELTSSKAALEDLLGERITTLSVPGGFYSTAVRETAGRCGYRWVCGSSWGINTPRTDPLNLLRIGVKNDPAAGEVAALVRGELLPMAKRKLSYAIRTAAKRGLGAGAYLQVRKLLLRGRAERDMRK